MSRIRGGSLTDPPLMPDDESTSICLMNGKSGHKSTAVRGQPLRQPNKCQPKREREIKNHTNATSGLESPNFNAFNLI